MSDDLVGGGGRILSFVQRVETLNAEKQEIADGIKEVFAEAKGEGFDVGVLKEIVKLRRQDKDQRDERETILDLYLRAMESASASA